MSNIRTQFNPGVGISYYIKNIKTGEVIKASTLTTRDTDQKPWRSPKGTKPGEEYFKAKSGNKKKGFTYYKFMNSIVHSQCISSDGEWLFDGRKVDGTIIPKLTDVVKNKKEKVSDSSNISQSNVVRCKVEKIIDDNKEVNEEKIITSNTDNDEFSNNGQLLELLNKE